VQHVPVLTLAALVRQRSFGLRVRAGADALDRPVDWVHVSELADPAPFLRPGTLLLTTGLQLQDAEEYVIGLDVVGIGFGVGLSYQDVPVGLVGSCALRGVPLLEVPLDTRFADIVRFVADDLARTAVREIRSTVDIERALIRALGTGDPQAEIVKRLAKWLGGWAMALDEDGRIEAVAPARARREGKAVRAELGRITPAGRFSVSWSAAGTQVSVHSFGHGYLAVGTPLLPSDGPAVIGIAAHLLSFQADQAAAGRQAERALRAAAARLLLHGLPGEAARLGVDLPQPPFRVAVVHGVDLRDELLCADELCVLNSEFGLAELLGETGRAALSDPVGAEDLPKAVAQARSLAGALTEPGVITRKDVTLPGLLSHVDTPEVRAYVSALLAPLPAALLDTLRVFLAADGSWAEASARLEIHRHTLRYRIGKIEDLLGKRLSDTGTRAELWLALHLDN
jgi:purine catabolism regulator